jgi:hypothetical protein
MPKVVLGEAKSSLNKLNSPEKMMAHLDSLVEAESKSDSKFAFKLTQICADTSDENTYISPVKKQAQGDSTSALETQLHYFDQFIANQRTLLPERLAK